MVNSKPTLTSDCALAVAIPLTLEDFEDDLKEGGFKDFTKSWMSQFTGLPAATAWNHFRSYALLTKEVACFAEDLHVSVNSRCTLSAWLKLLNSRRIVTLLAHCRKAKEPRAEDEIEFADGLYRVSAVLDAMPPTYCETLDLTLCHSLDLAAHFKTRFAKCTVIVNKRKARVDYRIAIYRQVLRLLCLGTYSFVDAMAEVHAAVLKDGVFTSRVAGRSL